MGHKSEMDRFPMHSKEHLSRLNHFSRVTYLEMRYASCCKELKEGAISRERFDTETQKILTLLGDAEFMSSGSEGVLGARFYPEDYPMMAQRWQEVAERQKSGEVPDEADIPEHWRGRV